MSTPLVGTRALSLVVTIIYTCLCICHSKVLGAVQMDAADNTTQNEVNSESTTRPPLFSAKFNWSNPKSKLFADSWSPTSLTSVSCKGNCSQIWKLPSSKLSAKSSVWLPAKTTYTFRGNAINSSSFKKWPRAVNLTAEHSINFNTTMAVLTWEYSQPPRLSDKVEVICEPACHRPINVLSTATTAFAASLTPGSSYTFRVTIRNVSTSDDSYTLTLVPAAVTDVYAVPSLTSNRTAAMVTWSHSPYTVWDHVIVSCDPPCPPVLVDDRNKTSATLTDLSPGEEYRFGVTAVSKNLSSVTEYTETLILELPSIKLHIIQENTTSVTLSWEELDTVEIGVLVLRYTVAKPKRHVSMELYVTNSNHSYTCNGLTPGYGYEFTMEGVLESANLSIWSNKATHTAAPLPPASLVVQDGDATHSLVFSWTPGVGWQDDFIVNLTDTSVEGKSSAIVTTDTTLTYKSLRADTRYILAIRSRADDKYSEWVTLHVETAGGGGHSKAITTTGKKDEASKSRFPIVYGTTIIVCAILILFAVVIFFSYRHRKSSADADEINEQRHIYETIGINNDGFVEEPAQDNHWYEDIDDATLSPQMGISSTEERNHKNEWLTSSTVGSLLEESDSMEGHVTCNLHLQDSLQTQVDSNECETPSLLTPVFTDMRLIYNTKDVKKLVESIDCSPSTGHTSSFVGDNEHTGKINSNEQTKASMSQNKQVEKRNCLPGNLEVIEPSAVLDHQATKEPENCNKKCSLTQFESISQIIINVSPKPGPVVSRQCKPEKYASDGANNKPGYVILSDLTGYEPLRFSEGEQVQPDSNLYAALELPRQTEAIDTRSKPGYIVLSELTGYEAMIPYEAREYTTLDLSCHQPEDGVKERTGISTCDITDEDVQRPTSAEPNKLSARYIYI